MGPEGRLGRVGPDESDTTYGGFARVADRMSKIAMTALIAAAVIFGSFMAITSYSDGVVKGYLPKAGQYLADGDYQRAAEFYSKYLKKNPGDKTATLGFIEAAIKTDRAGAREHAAELLGSGALIAADYPMFTQLCERIGDRGLCAAAYSKWLEVSPGHTGAMIELAKAYIDAGDFTPALDIIQSLGQANQSQVAAVLLGQAVNRAWGRSESRVGGRAGGSAGGSAATSPDEYVKLCELWYGADPGNLSALLTLAAAYAEDNMEAAAEECYRRALDMDVRNAEAYDGLLSLMYQNARLRERYDLLEAAIRNAGSRNKYTDMLESTRKKLAEYYSVIHEDGVTYKDGIYRITRYDPDGNEILAGGEELFGPDEISYLIEFYDNLGNEKQMFLDCAKIQVQIADIDYDGIREILIKRYITAAGMSEEAMRYSVWYDVYRIERDINKLIYSTPDYMKYYRNVYAPDIRRKLVRFEDLSEAMEGHYGVVYGILYALRIAALDFANGEWAPDGTGVDLRRRICQTLIVGDLGSYVEDKNTAYGLRDGDRLVYAPGAGGGGAGADSGAGGGAGSGAGTGAGGGAGAGADTNSGGVYPGMPEADVIALLGQPRWSTEEEMDALQPSGGTVKLKNKILEYAGLNLYLSDGVVKAFRVNSRDFRGPRGLRIGDTTYDIVNKFPSVYFDDIADFHTQKRNSDFELMDTENGVVLNYTIQNGIIMNIELYLRDASGDWKPGTNIETIIKPGAVAGSTAGAGNTGMGAAAAGEAGADGEGSANEAGTAGEGSAGEAGTAGDGATAEAGTAEDAATAGAGAGTAGDTAATGAGAGTAGEGASNEPGAAGNSATGEATTAAAATGAAGGGAANETGTVGDTAATGAGAAGAGTTAEAGTADDAATAGAGAGTAGESASNEPGAAGDGTTGAGADIIVAVG